MVKPLRGLKKISYKSFNDSPTTCACHEGDTPYET
jgi:hypothetical protein